MPTQKIIFRGIERAAKDSSAPDGGVDELINLRLKDGSLRPVGDLEQFPGFDTLPGHYDRLYIHTNAYRHLFGLSSGTLSWIANIVDGVITPLAEPRALLDGLTDTDALSVTQTGHLFVVNHHGLRYFLYREYTDTYDPVVTDFNTLTSRGLLPYGCIDFKVDEVRDTYGRPVWFSSRIEHAGIKGAYGDVEKVNSTPIIRNDVRQEECNVLKDIVGKTRADVAALNLFTQPFMVATAAELYDGNFILMSEPKLMHFPNIGQAQVRTSMQIGSAADGHILLDERTFDDQNFAGFLSPAEQRTDLKFNDIDDFRGPVFSDLISNLHELVYDWGGFDHDPVWQLPLPKHWQPQGLSPATAVMPDNRPYDYDHDLINDLDFRATSYAREAYMWHPKSGTSEPGYYSLACQHKKIWLPRWHKNMHLFGAHGGDETSCFLTANKLRFRINTALLSEYKDVIAHISVFITPPVEYYKFLDTDVKRSNYFAPLSDGDYMPSGSLIPNNYTNGEFTSEYYISPETNEKIIKELTKAHTFYRIADLSIDDYSAGKWYEVPIDEGVVSTLLSQDKLEIDSLGRDGYDARVAYPYNGRLHIADYEQTAFSGWPLNHFSYYGGVGQYPAGQWCLHTDKGLSKLPASSGKERIAGWIKVSLDDGNKQYSVVRKVRLYETLANKTRETLDIHDLTADGTTGPVIWSGPLGINAVHTEDSFYKRVRIPGGPVLNIGIEAFKQTVPVGSGGTPVCYPFFDYASDVYDLTAALPPVAPATLQTLVPAGALLQWLNPLLTYPSRHAKTLEIKLWDTNNLHPLGTTPTADVWHRTYDLTAHDFFNFSYYIDPDLKPITLAPETQEPLPIAIPEPVNASEWHHNRIKVSEVNNPIYFPIENVYTIGNSSIQGFAANANLLPGGQIGDAPLVVFCSDGIYGLFVDASGQFTYRNSRPVSLLICNNPGSITSTPAGVVFSTATGLHLLSAINRIQEISTPVEGSPFNVRTLPGATNILQHKQLVKLDVSAENFLDYIRTARIGYNHIEQELWITSPEYSYSYILAHGQWSKRTDTGSQFVTDYPETYLFDSNTLRCLSRETTPDRPAALLSRAITNGSQEFKQTARLILRGEYCLSDKQTVDATIDADELLKAGQQTIERINPPVTDLVERRPGDYPEITGDYVVRRTIVVSEREAPYMPDYDFGSPAAVQNQLLPRFFVNGQLDVSQRITDTPGDFRSPEWTVAQFGTTYVFAIRLVHLVPYTFRTGNFQVTLLYETDRSFTLAELHDLLQTEINNTATEDTPCRVRNQAAAEDLRINRLYYYTPTSSEPISAADIDIPSNYRIIHCRRTVRPITYLKYLDYATLQHSVDPSMPVFQAVDLADDIDTSRYNNPVNISAGYYRVKGVLYKLPDLSTTYDILEPLITKGVYTPVRLDFDVVSGNYYHLVTRTAERYICYTDPDATCTFADLWALPAYTPYTVNDTLQLTSGRQYHITIKVDNIDTVLQGNFTGKTNLYALNYLVEHSELFTPADPVTHLTAGSLYQFTTADGRVVLISSPDNIDAPLSRLEDFTVSSVPNLAGLYLFGSYDNKAWALLGGRELPGNFRDLGLLAHRVDCKYFRLLFVGKLTYPSSIELLEMDVLANLYHSKPR